MTKYKIIQELLKMKGLTLQLIKNPYFPPIIQYKLDRKTYESLDIAIELINKYYMDNVKENDK